MMAGWLVASFAFCIGIADDKASLPASMLGAACQRHGTGCCSIRMLHCALPSGQLAASGCMVGSCRSHSKTATAAVSFSNLSRLAASQVHFVRLARGGGHVTGRSHCAAACWL